MKYIKIEIILLLCTEPYNQLDAGQFVFKTRRIFTFKIALVNFILGFIVFNNC